jgi:hypothetical protein
VYRNYSTFKVCEIQRSWADCQSILKHLNKTFYYLPELALDCQEGDPDELEKLKYLVLNIIKEKKYRTCIEFMVFIDFSTVDIIGKVQLPERL